jgi:hypothetical protein
MRTHRRQRVTRLVIRAFRLWRGVPHQISQPPAPPVPAGLLVEARHRAAVCHHVFTVRDYCRASPRFPLARTPWQGFLFLERYHTLAGRGGAKDGSSEVSPSPTQPQRSRSAHTGRLFPNVSVVPSQVPMQPAMVTRPAGHSHADHSFSERGAVRLQIARVLGEGHSRPASAGAEGRQ